MAVRTLEAPARTRTRESKFKFSPKEVKEVISTIESGNLSGEGPFTGDGNEKKALREARSYAAALARAVKDANGKLDVGTRAWMGEDGAYGAVRVRS